jgi:hypothetical protein
MDDNATEFSSRRQTTATLGAIGQFAVYVGFVAFLNAGGVALQ